MYVCMYAHTYVCVHTYNKCIALRLDPRARNSFLCVCVYVRMYVNIYVCMYVCVCVCMHVQLRDWVPFSHRMHVLLNRNRPSTILYFCIHACVWMCFYAMAASTATQDAIWWHVFAKYQKKMLHTRTSLVKNESYEAVIHAWVWDGIREPVNVWVEHHSMYALLIWNRLAKFPVGRSKPCREEDVSCHEKKNATRS